MAAMLHLAKLAVGVRNVAHLGDVQARRDPLRHLTRNLPRRRDEILRGGSLYWVVSGAMVVRQRVLDITEVRLRGRITLLRAVSRPRPWCPCSAGR